MIDIFALTKTGNITSKFTGTTQQEAIEQARRLVLQILAQNEMHRDTMKVNKLLNTGDGNTTLETDEDIENFLQAVYGNTKTIIEMIQFSGLETTEELADVTMSTIYNDFILQNITMQNLHGNHEINIRQLRAKIVKHNYTINL